MIILKNILVILIASAVWALLLAGCLMMVRKIQIKYLGFTDDKRRRTVKTDIL